MIRYSSRQFVAHLSAVDFRCKAVRYGTGHSHRRPDRRVIRKRHENAKYGKRLAERAATPAAPPPGAPARTAAPRPPATVTGDTVLAHS